MGDQADLSRTGLKPLGYEQLTGLSTTKKLTPPDGANYAVLQAEGANVRYREDATDPTASVGMRILADREIPYSADLFNKNLNFIEESAAAKLNVHYYE